MTDDEMRSVCEEARAKAEEAIRKVAERESVCAVCQESIRQLRELVQELRQKDGTAERIATMEAEMKAVKKRDKQLSTWLEGVEEKLDRSMRMWAGFLASLLLVLIAAGVAAFFAMR